jgi:hypothetical protein
VAGSSRFRTLAGLDDGLTRASELSERAASDHERGVVWRYVWECPRDCAIRRQRRICERRRRLGLESFQLYEIPLVGTSRYSA